MTESNDQVEILRKMSPKAICGKIEKPEEDDDPTDLFIVGGFAEGIKTGESNFGAYTGFTGDFVATRLADGKRFAANVLYIPQPAQDMIGIKLRETDAEGKRTNANVAFAFVIGVKYADSQVGYEYTCRPVVESQVSDRMKAITQAMDKALPAPSSAGKESGSTHKSRKK